MTTIVNLTPHAITAAGISFPPSGQVARVTVTRAEVGTLNGVPVFGTFAGFVDGLPDPQEGHVYIVSTLVRTHTWCARRADLVSPGALIRDDAGNVIGADGFDANFSWEGDE
jgi:hypothetical protein